MSKKEEELALLIRNAIENDPKDFIPVRDLFDLVKGMGRGSLFAREQNAYLIKLTADRLRQDILTSTQMSQYFELQGDCLLFASHYDVDSYFQRLEWNRDLDKRFYLPRRPQLRPLIQAFQDIIDDELDVITVSMPPGSGKSSAGTFFMTMLMGIQADKYHVMSGYADSLTKMFYDNALSMITDPEYAWKEIFPHLGIVRQSGTDTYIDIGKRGAFPTLTTKPIGGSLTGRVRCSGVLYSDDLVSGIEEAMNPDRLDKLWQRYSNDLRSRTVNGFKEVMVATRWSVNDPIGRLQILHEGNPRAKFINMPALDENGESNFNYKYNLGFSTKHYLDMRDIMDDVSWNSLYMQEPYEREGLLYKDDELRRFYELPKQEPDAIISICDTKEKGSDYAFAPVAYVYGDDYYIADCIVDNSNPEFVEARIAQLYTSHKVQASRFESNSAGGRFADSVKEKIDKLGGITHITKKFTTQNKETKIVVNSPWVKEHCLFLDKSKIEPRSDYSRMMRMLTTYTMAGRNKNDDVVDGFAMLSQFAQSFMHKSIKVMKNPLKYL